MRRDISVIGFLTACLIVASCGTGQSAGPVATPTVAASATLSPTSTPIPLPTDTPTITPSPTPVPEMGKPVASDNWEVTLLAATFRERFVSLYTFQARDGYILIDVVAKVKNLKPGVNSPLLVNQIDAGPSDFVPETIFALDTPEDMLSDTSDAVIVDENGKSWLPQLWGDKKVVSGKEIDPFIVGVTFYHPRPEPVVDADGTSHYSLTIAVQDERYVRFMYPLAEASLGKTISFKLADVPSIPFTINK
jgi:hypothetical protein